MILTLWYCQRCMCFVSDFFPDVIYGYVHKDTGKRNEPPVLLLIQILHRYGYAFLDLATDYYYLSLLMSCYAFVSMTVCLLCLSQNKCFVRSFVRSFIKKHTTVYLSRFKAKWRHFRVHLQRLFCRFTNFREMLGSTCQPSGGSSGTCGRRLSSTSHRTG